jgi:hypothetical protein
VCQNLLTGSPTTRVQDGASTCRFFGPFQVSFARPRPLSPTTSILPVFNQDREYFTPCFLLSSDQVLLPLCRNTIKKTWLSSSANSKRRSSVVYTEDVMPLPKLLNNSKQLLPTPTTVKSARKNLRTTFNIFS